MTSSPRTAGRPLLSALLCSLVLLTPGLGLAQQAPGVAQTPPTTPTEQTPPEPAKAPEARLQRPADAPVPGTAPQAPVRLLKGPQAEARPSDELRISTEVGLGLAGLLVGGAVGSFGGFQIGASADSLYLGLAFAGLSSVLGVSLGTYLGGQLMGGEGDFYGPFLGAVAGVVVGGGVGALSVLAPLAAALAVGGAVAGAAVGYECTEHGGPTRVLRPVVGVSSRGPMLGLSGTF